MAAGLVVCIERGTRHGSNLTSSLLAKPSISSRRRQWQSLAAWLHPPHPRGCWYISGVGYFVRGHHHHHHHHENKQHNDGEKGDNLRRRRRRGRGLRPLPGGYRLAPLDGSRRGRGREAPRLAPGLEGLGRGATSEHRGPLAKKKKDEGKLWCVLSAAGLAVDVRRKEGVPRGKGTKERWRGKKTSCRPRGLPGEKNIGRVSPWRERENSVVGWLERGMAKTLKAALRWWCGWAPRRCWLALFLGPWGTTSVSSGRSECRSRRRSHSRNSSLSGQSEAARVPCVSGGPICASVWGMRHRQSSKGGVFAR